MISRFSSIVLDSVCDGDMSTVVNNIPYATNVREVVSVDDMISHSIRRGDFLETT